MDPQIEAEAVERLGRYIDDRLRAGGPPGVSIAITDRDRTMHVGTHGLANVDAGLPVAPGHRFQIGSVGKGFTATLVLQLVAEGAIDLHAPVTDYVPWFEVESEHGPITTHHLLTHSAGLITGSLAFIDARSEVWALRRTRTGAPPGEFFHYSDVGYETIGLIVTAVTGRPFREVLDERVLEPLGMAASVPHFLNDARPSLAVGYTPTFDDVPFVPGRSPLSPAPWFIGDSADGSISSTASDMTAYLRLLLHRGSSPGRLITPESFSAMTTPWIRWEDGEDESYGYGIGVYRAEGRTVLRHSGGTIGYITQLLADLDAGIGVIVLSNGPFEIYSSVRSIAQFALDLMVAAGAGDPLPELPAIVDPSEIADAERFAGRYEGAEGELRVHADGTSLSVVHGGTGRALARIEPDGLTFTIEGDADAWLEFGLDDRGEVTEVFHGRHRYAKDPGDEGADSVSYPPEWDALAGAYRAHDPWRPLIRFVVRKGSLWMIYPSSGTAHALTPDGDSTFRFARDVRLPERVRFHAFADGSPLRVELEGFDHYRAPDRRSAWNARSE